MTQNIWKHITRYGNAVLLTAVLLVTAAFPSTATDDPPLASFMGDWQSNGDAFGRPAVSTIKFAPAFGGKLVHLQYNINIITNGTPTPAFSGVAYYKQLTDDRYQAFWADIEGSIHPIASTLEGQALTSIWGTEETRLGRTRYEILSDGTMRITDWARVDDEWKQFNDNVYKRLHHNIAHETK
ncbi:hypothetical protein [Kordiimonas aquimaris]|uniref:hypothetical protein n=1 Tax=Kordiimonas aquimaris TaxID=707591 RepID=UPI0021CF61E9|nr:hypothetical protein [Kordiimonas aquimaris]